MTGGLSGDELAFLHGRLDPGADPDAGGRSAAQVSAFFEFDEMAALLARQDR